MPLVIHRADNSGSVGTMHENPIYRTAGIRFGDDGTRKRVDAYGGERNGCRGNGTRNCKFCQLFRVAVKWGPLLPRWGVCEGTLVNKQYKK